MDSPKKIAMVEQQPNRFYKLPNPKPIIKLITIPIISSVFSFSDSLDKLLSCSNS